LNPNQTPDLIETMRADRSGRIELLSLHLDRLSTSALALGHVYPGQAAVQSVLTESFAKVLNKDPLGIDAESVSITSTSHVLPNDFRVRLLLAPSGQLTVTIVPLPALPRDQRVAFSRTTLPSESVWLQHKTTHRPWYQNAMAWIDAHPGYFDLIYLNERGEVCEGSRSSIYAKINDQWVTPPTRCGLLSGVQRRALLKSESIEQAVLRCDDLLGAQALRLSNALRGWFDVTLDPHIKD
jgi:4-amino-4-deoxychorismate lyase